MKKYIPKYVSALLFLLLSFPDAGQFVKITVEKDKFLKYEPVYMEINFDLNYLPEGYFMSGLRDSRAMVGLVILDPYGNRIYYQAPMKLFTMNTQDVTFFESLLISKNDFLFENTGNYTLFLVDKKSEEQISNSINIYINEATIGDDIEIQNKIKNNPIDYAMFVDLEGGDQFTYGKEIIEEMYKRKTSYHTVAATLLAINSAQIKYDWKNNKIARNKDISAVENYLPDITGKCYIPKYLKLQAATIIMDQFNEKDLSDKIKVKINTIGKMYNKEIKRSSRFKAIESHSSN